MYIILVTELSYLPYEFRTYSIYREYPMVQYRTEHIDFLCLLLIHHLDSYISILGILLFGYTTYKHLPTYTSNIES